jgi:hypothetical protein
MQEEDSFSISSSLVEEDKNNKAKVVYDSLKRESSSKFKTWLINCLKDISLG